MSSELAMQNKGSELPREVGRRLPDLEVVLVGHSKEPGKKGASQAFNQAGERFRKDSLSIRREDDGVDGSLEVDVMQRRPSAEGGEDGATV